MSAFVEALSQEDERLAQCVGRRRVSKGDELQARDALGQLYDRHAPGLLTFLAARVRRDDVEDIHQAVWQRVWERLPDCFQEGNFRAWLFQVTRNYLIDWRRKKHPESLSCEQELLIADRQATDPAEAILEQERWETLRRCLKRLAPTLADVIQARLAGEAYDSICQRLGVTLPQAQKMLFRAKHFLQVCVKQSQ